MAVVPPDRLSDVLITEQLHRRVPHNADYKREKLAIQELAQQMVDHPEGLMPGLVRLAIEACDAQSAGISLYEPDPPGPGIFRWHHLAGHFANLSGGTIPRDFSPSGIAIDQGVPILMARPERFYAYPGQGRRSALRGPSARLRPMSGVAESRLIDPMAARFKICDVV
jgi:hypothetical protein